MYRQWQSQWESDPADSTQEGEDDSNAIYCSVILYRHLWVSDHYQFYIKATPLARRPVYLAKRYSNF